jgi:glycosyltransferase involved in cell wall biosynthesis
MNIAFVNATHRWGGVKSWTLRVAAGLLTRGHAVTVFLRPGDPFQAACRSAGAATRTVRFGPDWNPLAVRTLKRAFREGGIEVVVTNVSKDNRIAGPACRALGLPVLQRVGGPGDITDRWRIRRDQTTYVTRVVVPGRAVRDVLSRFPWMDVERRVTVVPNGVDLGRFRPGSAPGFLRSELSLSPSVPVVVTTGQLSAIKGHDRLLRAFAAIPDRAPRPVLVLVGGGKQEPLLRERARELGLGERVVFLGFRRDVDRLIDDADLAVHPSLIEGFPNSVVEFMAAGKAIIATRLPGVAEAITHDEEGWLVAPESTEELTAAMSRLLEDASLRERLGAAARRRAEAELGEETMIARVERLLAGMVGSGRSSADSEAS